MPILIFSLVYFFLRHPLNKYFKSLEAFLFQIQDITQTLVAYQFILWMSITPNFFKQYWCNFFIMFIPFSRCIFLQPLAFVSIFNWLEASIKNLLK